MTGRQSQRAMRAYEQAGTGDFAESAAYVAEFDGAGDPLAKAWVLALRQQRWHAQPKDGALASLDRVAEFVDADGATRGAALMACAEAAKYAVLTHDVSGLSRWVELQQRLVSGCDDPAARVWTKLGEAWLGAAQGEAARAEIVAKEAGELAASSHLGPAVIEATVLRALCAETKGDVEAATTLARRAVRMARAEDLPQWQYLASLVLARIRRLNGVPHLTARILSALAEVAPAPWQGWIAWEALMAGAFDIREELTLDDENDPRREARVLDAFLGAAAEGDQPGFHEAAARLESLEAAWHSRAVDVRLALAAVDARQPIDGVSDELRAWYRGQSDTPPTEINGLCVDLLSDRSDPGPAAFVVAGPHTDSLQVRRIAGMGELVVSADTRVDRVRGTAERTPTTLAAAALAGRHGITREDLFRTVYGFEYEHNVHKQLFYALVHRVRKELGDMGELKGIDGERFILEPNQVMVIPDPRCEQSLEELMLQALAGGGAQTAQSAAERVGIALRTAQGALKRLVESGALVTEKDPEDGRLIRYSVEDTTFSEPTKWS